MNKILTVIHAYNSDFSLKHYYILIYILATALIAVITLPYGPSIGGDSIDYISTATNLAEGNGFINHKGNVYTTWPPLYPIILAVATKFTSLSVYTSGWIINSMAFGVFLILAARLFQISLPPKPIWSILATLTLLFSFSSLAIFASIAADPIFILLVLLFLIQIQFFLKNKNFPSIAYLGLISAMATFQRWNGVILIILGVIMILFAFQKSYPRALIASLGFSIISVLPASIWIFAHTYNITGTLFGAGASPIRGKLLQNTMGFIVPRITHWFIPVSLTNIIPPIVFGIGFILLFIIVGIRLDLSRIIARLTNQKIFPLILFILLYLPFVALTTIIADHPNIFDDRYLIPIFPPLLILIFWFIHALIISLSNIRLKKYGQYLVSVCFAIWLLYPINIIRKNVIYSINHGPPIGNEYNIDQWRNSKTIAFIQTFDFNSDYAISSNFPDAVYLYTGKTSVRSPLDNDNHPALLENLPKSIAAWEDTPRSYLVWFIPNCCKDLYSPEQLATQFYMTIIYSSVDGMLILMERID